MYIYIYMYVDVYVYLFIWLLDIFSAFSSCPTNCHYQEGFLVNSSVSGKALMFTLGHIRLLASLDFCAACGVDRSFNTRKNILGCWLLGFYRQHARHLARGENGPGSRSSRWVVRHSDWWVSRCVALIPSKPGSFATAISTINRVVFDVSHVVGHVPAVECSSQRQLWQMSAVTRSIPHLSMVAEARPKLCRHSTLCPKSHVKPCWYEICHGGFWVPLWLQPVAHPQFHLE